MPNECIVLMSKYLGLKCQSRSANALAIRWHNIKCDSHSKKRIKCDVQQKHAFQYQQLDTKTKTGVSHPIVIAELTIWRIQNPTANIHEIVSFSLDYTKQKLSFTFGLCTVVPNDRIHNPKTDWEGYSLFFTGVVDFLLGSHQISEWQTEILMGRISIAGQSASQFFHSPFFTDHEYTRVFNSITNEELLIDPSLYEMMNIQFVSH